MDEDTLKRIAARVRYYDQYLSEGTGDHFAEELQVLALVAEVRRLREELRGAEAQIETAVAEIGRLRSVVAQMQQAIDAMGDDYDQSAPGDHAS